MLLKNEWFTVNEDRYALTYMTCDGVGWLMEPVLNTWTAVGFGRSRPRENGWLKREQSGIGGLEHSQTTMASQDDEHTATGWSYCLCMSPLSCMHPHASPLAPGGRGAAPVGTGCWWALLDATADPFLSVDGLYHPWSDLRQPREGKDMVVHHNHHNQGRECLPNLLSYGSKSNNTHDETFSPPRYEEHCIQIASTIFMKEL